MTSVPLIPREIIFGNPEKSNPLISPDGRFLAYIAPDENNVLQVWLKTIGKDDDRIITADRKRGIRIHFWTYDERHLIYMQDSDGDENYHLYSVDVKTGVVRDLTPFQGILAYPVAIEPTIPNEILVAMNINDKSKHDVYRINLTNGAIELEAENPGNIADWFADAKLNIRAAFSVTQDSGGEILYRANPDKPWRSIRKWTPDDEGRVLQFSQDGKILHILSSQNANALRLLAIDLETNVETVIAEDTEYDVDEVMAHPLKRTIEAVSFNKDMVEWHVIDKSIEKDFDYLKTVKRGVFDIISRDISDKTWIVAYTTDDGPVHYYYYDRNSQKATFLFSARPKLDEYILSQMAPISVQARDGLTIHGYLSLPVGVEPRNLPTVLLVHGGPWWRDSWGYQPEVQLLTNRGYAVLQVNFRGSTGYGKKFLAASFREWGGKMHDDLIDAVNWLIEKGIADPQKIAIMGGSYGGYATLAGLTFTPDVFVAGVDIVGTSNLITFINTIPPYWQPMISMLKKRIGDIETEEDFLKSRSPINFVDRIKAPLLIAHGANDPRVKQSETDQIVKALRDAGKHVECIVYTDEGHGFARPENRLHFYAKTEEFLSRYLGGRIEAMGEIKGHSGVEK